MTPSARAPVAVATTVSSMSRAANPCTNRARIPLVLHYPGRLSKPHVCARPIDQLPRRVLVSRNAMDGGKVPGGGLVLSLRSGDNIEIVDAPMRSPAIHRELMLIEADLAMNWH